MNPKAVKLFFTLLFTSTLFHSAVSSLHSKFSRFQILRAEDFRIRLKRNDRGQLQHKHVTFTALGHTFQMQLMTGCPSLADDFTVDAVHSTGNETPVELNMDDIYHGTLVGDKTSWVTAVRHELGVWTALIASSIGTFYIEPLAFHDAESGLMGGMVIYPHEHVKPPNTNNNNGNSSSSKSHAEGGDEMGGDKFCQVYEFADADENEEDVQGRERNLENESENDETRQKLSSKPKSINKPGKIRTRRRKSLTLSDNDTKSENGGRFHRAYTGSPTNSRLRHTDFVNHSEKRRSLASHSDRNERLLNRNQNKKQKRRPQSRPSTDSRGSFDTCDIIVLADFKAFAGIGKMHVNTMAKFLVATYAGVDQIFKSTKFGEYEGVRIMVKKMKIFTSQTATDNIGRHLLMTENNITDVELLKSVTKIEYLGQYCAAHLTTQRNFKGILGVATQARLDQLPWSHGICSEGVSSSRNVGLSTVIDSGNKYLPIKNYIDVVTHEIGHNFGATHDDDFEDAKCRPSSNHGGKYLMWARSTTSSNVNNNKFSPCSTKLIEQLLKLRATRCLKPSYLVKRNQCGNGVLDYTEECDGGESDPCCSTDCRLVGEAVCTPFNSPCCSANCSIAPTTQKCTTELDTDCLHESSCSGKTFEHCPMQMAKEQGSSCGDGGKCKNGQCVSFCTLVGQARAPSTVLKTCHCDHNRTAMCRVCCVDLSVKDFECRAYQQTYHDGAPCLLGVCHGGVCRDLEPLVVKESLFKNKGSIKSIVTLVGIVIGVCVLVALAMYCRIWCNNRASIVTEFQSRVSSESDGPTTLSPTSSSVGGASGEARGRRNKRSGSMIM